MNANFKPISEVGSCNFCNRGELAANGNRLKYPYRKVWVLTGSEKRGPCTSVRMCNQCVDVLWEKQALK